MTLISYCIKRYISVLKRLEAINCSHQLSVLRYSRRVLYIDERIHKRATTYASGDSFWLSQNDYNTLKDFLRKLKNTLYI